MKENTKNSILDAICKKEKWDEFLAYKTERRHMDRKEQKLLEEYIGKEKYIAAYEQMKAGTFPNEYATKKFINKSGTKKKRVVYSFSDDVNITLKFISHYLYVYDDRLEENCYAFRKNHGVRQALGRLTGIRKLPGMYCLKADIHNYFNSIDVPLLLEKMDFIKEDDAVLYRVFERILLEKRVNFSGHTIAEEHGAMAGLPIAPFFANIYLQKLDSLFAKENTIYFRYSDDVLIFADSLEELERYKTLFFDQLKGHKLTVNPSKMSEKNPGEKLEFLGFSYEKGNLDLSDNTKRKIKGKIKRKAEALRRWQRKKGLSPDKAAVGFINAMNKKFFGYGDEDEFTWERWFFPNLTVTDGLKEVDHYMQQYIRYCVTGRHYKGNYRITYEQMKEWGYVNLVHAYYEWHAKNDIKTEN
ncbi:MAG: hypothetical protein IJ274_16000 [Lachnospiraceae bacterium]|nr:hypothetical protein [Lachnospiraceae bacterium]